MCDLQLTIWLVGAIHKVGILQGKSHFNTVVKVLLFSLTVTAPYIQIAHLELNTKRDMAIYFSKL